MPRTYAPPTWGGGGVSSGWGRKLGALVQTSIKCPPPSFSTSVYTIILWQPRVAYLEYLQFDYNMLRIMQTSIKRPPPSFSTSVCTIILWQPCVAYLEYLFDYMLRIILCCCCYTWGSSYIALIFSPFYSMRFHQLL